MKTIKSWLHSFNFNLQSVSPVPIPSLLQHLLGLGDVGGGDGVVVVEQAHSDVQEHQVHPVAEADLFNDEGGKKEKKFLTHRFLIGEPDSLNSGILVTNL